MNSERLNEIAQPLELLFRAAGFVPEGDPLIDGTEKMAIFVRPDGAKIDYAFNVKRDVDSGNFGSDSAISLNAKLYTWDGAVNLYNADASSNMPATKLMADIVSEDVQPALRRGLGYTYTVL